MVAGGIGRCGRSMMLPESCMVSFSLHSGEDAEGEAFYGTPPELVLVALRRLARSKRCELFDDDEGVPGLEASNLTLQPRASV